MEYASAMKYGGELISAKDCDYSDFTELIPLCPECKEVVFLRKGGDRTSGKGTPYQIDAHWCHTKGRDPEHVAGCEMRVSGYTEKDKARIAAKAKGQRQELIKKWFLEVSFDFWTPNAFLSPWFNLENKKAAYSLAALKDTAIADCAVEEITINFSKSLATLDSMLAEFEHKFIGQETPESLFLEKNYSFVTQYFNSFPYSLHQKIVKEVFSWLVRSSPWGLAYDFIKTFEATYDLFERQNGYTVEFDLTSKAMYFVGQQKEAAGEDVKTAGRQSPAMLTRIAEQALNDALWSLVRTPWIEAFEVLESKQTHSEVL